MHMSWISCEVGLDWCVQLVCHGFPSNLTDDAIGHLWNHQLRVRQWGGASQCNKINIHSSMPQEDSLPRWALNVVLPTPVQIIAPSFPDTTNVVFMADRTFASPTVEQCVQVWDLWKYHIQAIGMQDNITKTQFTFACRNKKQRDKRQRHPSLQTKQV